MNIASAFSFASFSHFAKLSFLASSLPHVVEAWATFSLLLLLTSHTAFSWPLFSPQEWLLLNK